MKKTALLAIAILLVAGAANAQYMGLYADVGHSVCSVINPGGFFPFEMWVWCMPSVDGQICAEFMIGYPPNIIASTVTWNDPLISVTLGDLGTGLSVCYTVCQYDWNWPAHQMIYLTDTTPSWIEILPHPDSGGIFFADCTPGYPLADAVILNHLALNQTCEIAVEESSWGAIKGMFE